MRTRKWIKRDQKRIKIRSIKRYARNQPCLRAELLKEMFRNIQFRLIIGRASVAVLSSYANLIEIWIIACSQNILHLAYFKAEFARTLSRSSNSAKLARPSWNRNSFTPNHLQEKTVLKLRTWLAPNHLQRKNCSKAEHMARTPEPRVKNARNKAIAKTVDTSEFMYLANVHMLVQKTVYEPNSFRSATSGNTIADRHDVIFLVHWTSFNTTLLDRIC